MKIVRPLLIVCGLAGIGLASMAEDLFPAKAGSTWRYSGTAGGQAFNPICTVTSSKQSGGKKIATMRWTMNGSAIQEETYGISATEVVRIRSGAGGANSIEPPLPIIKYPMSAGKSWSWKGTVAMGTNKFQGTAMLKVGALEKVKTGAGTLSAYRVDLSLTVSGRGQSVTIPNTYWFSPGKGMVKQKATVNGTVIEATATKIVIK